MIGISRIGTVLYAVDKVKGCDVMTLCTFANIFKLKLQTLAHHLLLNIMLCITYIFYGAHAVLYVCEGIPTSGAP